jgi:predicted DNA-binding transcriptional regulator YafY
VYRDIATLQESGARIDGAPGLGFVLKPGFQLPPLMLDEQELEALVLGSRWVAERSGDPALAQAARQALAKICAVLPPSLQTLEQESALMIWKGKSSTPAVPSSGADLVKVRAAIRRQRKLHMHYRDQHDAASERTVWPLALGFFDQVHILVGWCELREDFRHFRIDRIASCAVVEQGFPRHRVVLLNAWRKQLEAECDRRHADRN